MSGRLVAVLGAAGTGKTTLARELTRILTARDMDAVMVPQTWREVIEPSSASQCLAERRAMAAEQTRLIAEARAAHQLVLADTTPLMLSLETDAPPLREQALRDHAQVGTTLLMSLDLAWTKPATTNGRAADAQADSQARTDTLIRQALQEAGQPYAVVAGHGIARVEHALSIIDLWLDEPARQTRRATTAGSRWRWFCDNCDDGECEQHWLTRQR